MKACFQIAECSLSYGTINPAPCAQNTDPVGFAVSASLSYPVSAITSSLL